MKPGEIITQKKANPSQRRSKGFDSTGCEFW